jgi:alcohol dehydrogenase class IV
MQTYFELLVRPRVMYKPGLVRELANEIATLGATRAFLVADAGIERAGLLEPVLAGLAGAVEVCGIFTDVPANSSVDAVERGAALARSANADLLVAIGGGSPIDTAKAMRILLTEGGNILDHQGYNLLNRPLTPMVAIPTTAGTGSEVTSWAVIRDEANGLKLTYASPFLGPDLAVLDPEMTLGLPPRITAATGLDALTHAIESFVGTNANPIADTLALQAIRSISQHLHTATHQGNNLEARGHMLIAACIAGIAFSSGGGNLGIVHAIAHSIGGIYEVHHGTANAILLPYGMQFNAALVPQRYTEIGYALGLARAGTTDAELLNQSIAVVRSLISECGLPMRLRDVGVPREGFEAIAELALGDPAIFTNPRQANELDIMAILESAW